VRLTTSLQVGAKYLGCVVCRFHVAAGAESTTHPHKSSGAVAKSASNNRQEFLLSPTGRLNFGFIAKGKLTAVFFTPSSWGSQLVRQHRRIKKFSSTIAKEKEDFCKGSLSLPIFLLCYSFAYFLYFICVCIFLSKIQKISSFYSCYFCWSIIVLLYHAFYQWLISLKLDLIGKVDSRKNNKNIIRNTAYRKKGNT
jgi:hypothetical protein